jgi:hypothetical protein
MAPTSPSRNGSPTALRASIPHAVPGRLRVKVQGRQSEVRDVLRAVRESLSGQPGIRSVTAEPRTGSALVVFDPEELDLQSAVALVQKAHEALAEVLPPSLQAKADEEVSVVAAALTHKLSRLDRTVYRATHGVLDLRMVVPISLAGLSARQLIRYGVRFRSVPWYTLAYYSFDTFIKLHISPPRGDRGDRPAAGTPR